jgi:Uri superfamily endonuclease
VDEPVPSETGAYVLLIELSAPLEINVATLPRTVLFAGRHAYCGSAYGPGGLKARIGRHLRADKAPRWHVDRLTAAGRGRAGRPGGARRIGAGRRLWRH